MSNRVPWLALILLSVLLSSCGGGNSSSSNPPPPPPPPSLPAYSVGGFVTATSTQPEAEEVIAADPNNASGLVAAIIDFSLRTPGFGTIKYAVSADAGSTWSESFVPLTGLLPTTSDGQQWQDNRDPSIAVDKLGNVFLAGIYEQPPQSGAQQASGLYVCQGTLPSVSILASACRPVLTNLAADNPSAEDKGAIATDNSNSAFANNVYAVWIHFTGCAGGGGCTAKEIDFSRSTDHGATWAAPTALTTGNSAVAWPQIVVGSDGTLYVAYEVVLSNNQAQHMLAISSDGGTTFAAAQAITSAYQDITFNTTYRKNSGPNIAVSSVSGAEYVYDAYAVQNGTGSDIVVTRSNQPKGAGGFTSPVAINDSSAGQRLFPSVAVDDSGVVHTSWFDTRNAGLTTDMYDIYATYSKDSGVTFAPNARVTRSLISAGNFIGDYAGITVDSTGVAHPVWTDGGSTNGTLQTTTLTAP